MHNYRIPCEKIRYATEEQAINAMHKHWRKGNPGAPMPVRYYPCSACSGWHLTSEPMPESPDA